MCKCFFSFYVGSMVKFISKLTTLQQYDSGSIQQLLNLILCQVTLYRRALWNHLHILSCWYTVTPLELSLKGLVDGWVLCSKLCWFTLPYCYNRANPATERFSFKMGFCFSRKKKERFFTRGFTRLATKNRYGWVCLFMRQKFSEASQVGKYSKHVSFTLRRARAEREM